MEKSKPLEIYELNADRNHQLMLNEKKTLFLISVLRLLIFAGGICLSVTGFSFNIVPGISISLISISLFLYMLLIYEEHSRKMEFYSNLENINLNEIKALTGDLSSFFSGEKWIDPAHDFSNDIDLFGKDSIFQFLNRTVTGHGREKLAHWLSDPYIISADLRIRQEAVMELSEKIGWRQEFIACGLGKSLEKDDIEKLLEWLTDESGFKLSPFLRILIWICPFLTITSLLMLVAGLLPYQIFTSFFIINLLIILFRVRDTGKIHGHVTKKHAFLISLSSLMYSFEKESFNSALMKRIKKEISSDELSAVHSLKKLSRIIQSFDSRLNPFVGIVFNGLMMWDMHCIRALEKWKDESKQTFPGWLDKIGEIDALLSIANLAYNNPKYSYPVLSDNGIIFSALNMGHPLIKSEARICNDLIIHGGGNIFIITGANMSGKSTFLRTVAVNFILAMIGSPVCATKMQFIPVKLFTSMRTTDSLSHNESYFYAELKRLKTLKISLENETNSFFILDEILKGTNSVDKSNGSKQFMRKMVELGGTGLIATHDTSLCDLQKEFPDKIVTKCFELEIEGEKILFDYKLIDGVTSKMNAALLMKQMGIA
jgi:DNA mismatch repair ATPase MutS